MNKKTNKNIPELRFPEFVEDGEWVEKRFGDIGEFFGGGTPSRSNSEYWIGNIPWISSSDISEEDIHNISISQFINEEAVKASATKIIPKGSILFVSRVGVGKLAINKKAELCTSQDFTNFLPTKVLNYFIAYYFSAHKNLLKSICQGTSIQGFSKSDLEDFKIGYPVSSEEQQKIANCLSSLDEVIAAHSQKLDLLKEHKKGLMQNLFPQEGETVPKYRFPEFVNDGEWEEKTLGEIIEIKGRIGYRGYTLEDIVSKGEGAISMSPSNIDEFGTLNFTKSTYITWAKYEESPEIMLNDDFSVLVKTGSTYGKVAFIKNLKEKTTINPQLVVLKPLDVQSYFLYLIISNSAVQRQINETVVGGAIPTLSQDSISKFKVLIPKQKEQQKIASCLSSLDALTTAQSDKLEQLKLHKKGLMQSMFPQSK